MRARCALSEAWSSKFGSWGRPAAVHPKRISAYEVKIRLESQLSWMNCQMFFDRIELGRLCRQGQQRDVLGYRELGREVPTGLIEQDDSVSAWGDRAGDLCQL